MLFALRLLLCSAQACTFNQGSCSVACGSIVYDLSSYASPKNGYFQAQDSQPAQFYYSVCSALSQVSCPNPQGARMRRLQSGGSSLVAIQDWGDPCPAPGSGPCVLSEKCATLGVYSAADRSCQANGTAGLICKYNGGSGGRSVDFDFACSASDGQASVYQVGSNSYVINLPGPAGCGKTGGAGKGGLSWGSLFCILLPVFVLLYLGGGIAYNVKVNQLDLGVEAIPQLEYWKQLPGLVQDGCRFSYVQTKKAYVMFRDRNKDPALRASLKSADDDDMAAALGS